MKEHNKIFMKYTIPTIMGMLVTTLYTFVDGIFVGQFIGAQALASINIVFPFLSIFIAISAMIATGGGALVSINFGRKDNERAQNLFGQSMSLALIILSAFSLFCVIFPETLSKLLGASEALLPGCVEYIRNFMYFGVFNGMTIVLNTFVNNDQNPILAFGGMLAGCVTNIFLDWLFVAVFAWGLTGAAVASGIGQVVACAVMISHFFTKKAQLKLRLGKLKKADSGKIIKTGLPVFVSELTLPISNIAYNFVIISMLGEKGIASFGVIMYIITIFFCIFSGVSQGMQPPISRFYGEQRFDMVRKIFRSALKLNIAIGFGLYILIFIFAKQAIMIFTHDQSIIPMTIKAMRIYNLFALFACVNYVIVSLFQAVRITKVAMTISVLKGFVFNLIFILTLPFVFGENGIWIAMTCSEATTFLLAFYMYRKNQHLIEKGAVSA